MKLRTIAVIAAIASVSSGSALAQQSNWYAGGSIGTSNVKFDNNSLAVSGSTANSYSKDENDTAYKLIAGYQFNSNFAVEGGYVDLGKFKITNNVTAPAVGSATGTLKADGWIISAVGLLPLNDQWSLIGKVGTVYSTVKVDASTTGALTIVNGNSRKASSWDATYGLGVQYAVTKSVAVRAEWERYNKLGTSTTGEGDVDAYSVGVNFKF